MTELLNEFNAQMAETPALVQGWMDWMGIIFLASVVYVKKHKVARYALGAMILSIPLALLVFYLSKTVHLLGIVHLAVWAPLLIYIVKKDFKSEGFNIKSGYGIWVILLSLTITISLLFDVRDIYLVTTGQK